LQRAVERADRDEPLVARRRAVVPLVRSHAMNAVIAALSISSSVSRSGGT
jgi:hypothetical protein